MRNAVVYDPDDIKAILAERQTLIHTDTLCNTLEKG